jgi:hypothetical protein
MDGKKKILVRFSSICFFLCRISLNVVVCVLDFNVNPGLSKLQKSFGVCACMLCFNQENMELTKCLFATKNYNPSNLNKHIHSHHSEEDAPDFFKVESKGRGRAAGIPHSSDSVSRITTGDNASTINSFFSELSSKQALDIWSRKAHKFFNVCGISFRCAASPEFKELMSFTVQNAAQLKTNQDRLMLGHHKFSQISKTRLHELIFVVNSLIEESKNYFADATGKCIPRLCISHDIWESKNGHWLGITLFFVDVTNWEMISFPIGFKRSKGKKACQVYEQVQDTIRR